MNGVIKISIVACVFASIILASCKDNNSSDSSTIDKVTARVEYGNEYNDYIDEVWGVIYYDDWEEEYVAERSKYVNGGFTIDLPSTVSNTYLTDIMDELGWIQEYPNGSISDKSAKIGLIWFEAYDDGYYLGDFEYYKYEENETPSNYSVRGAYAVFIYTDKNVSLKGSYSETGDSWREEETINLNLKKGWNQIFETFEYSFNENTGNEVSKQSLTTSNPGGLKWYFVDFDDDYDWKTTTKSVEKGVLSEKFKLSSNKNRKR